MKRGRTTFAQDLPDILCNALAVQVMSFTDRSQMVYGSATSARASIRGSPVRRPEMDRVVDPLALWASPGRQTKESPAQRTKFVINHAMTIEEAITVSQEHTRVLQADIMKLQMELSESLMKMESAHERAEAAETQISRLEVQCHEYEWQIKAQHTADIDQNMELKKLREQIVALQTDNHVANSEKDRRGVTLESEGRQYREEIQGLHQELNRLAAKLNHTEQSLSISTDGLVQSNLEKEALRAERDAFKKQIANLHDHLTRALKEKEAAEVLAKKASFDCEEAVRKENEMGKRILAIDKDRDQLREFGDEMASTLKQSATKKDQMSNEIKGLTDEVNLLKVQLTKNSQDMALMRVSVDQAEVELQRAKKEHEHVLVEQEETSVRRIQKVKAESATRAARNETLAGVLEESSKILATTKSHLNRATEHKRLVLSKAILRMQHLSEFKCWNNWKDAVGDEKRLRAAAGKILFRWMMRGTAKAFATWQGEHRHTKKLQKLQRSILSRWTTRDLSRAFNSWVTNHMEQLRLDAAKGKIITRWLARSLSRAFEKWASEHKEEKDRARKLFGALSKWLNRTKTAAFGLWRVRVSAEQAMRHRLARCVAMWVNGAMTRTFNAWLANATWLRNIRKTSLNVILRMQSRALSMAFETMADTARQERRLRALTARAIAMWTRPTVAKVFNGWANLPTPTEKMGKAVTRWSKSAMAAAMERWAEESLLATRAKRHFTQATRRWEHMWVYKAWGMWREFVTEIQWEDRVKYRVLTRILRVKTAMAFATWVRNTDDGRAYMTSRRWVARRSVKKTKAWAWNAWTNNKLLVVKWHRLVAASCLILVQMEATGMLEALESPDFPPPPSQLGATEAGLENMGLAALLDQWAVTLQQTARTSLSGTFNALQAELESGPDSDPALRLGGDSDSQGLLAAV